LSAANSCVSGEIFNVGSSSHYSVNQLVELLEGEVVSIPKRPGEPDCTFADVHKIQDLLNWRAEVPFEEGVKRLLACIDDFKTAPLWEPESIEKATQSWFTHLGEGEKACSDNV